MTRTLIGSPTVVAGGNLWAHIVADSVALTADSSTPAWGLLNAPLTISQWVRFPTGSLPAVDTTIALFSFGGVTTSSDGWMTIRLQRNSANYTGWRLNIQLRPTTGGSSTLYSCALEFAENTDYHFTYHMLGPAAAPKFLINGVEQTLTLHFGPAASPGFGQIAGGDYTYIGAYAWYSQNVGNYDFYTTNWQLWNANLWNTESSSIYALGPNGSPSGLDFSGGSGGTLIEHFPLTVNKTSALATGDDLIDHLDPDEVGSPSVAFVTA